MTEKIHFNLTIPDELGGLRLDQALVKLLPDYSRSQIQSWIKNAEVTVDQQAIKARVNVIGGEQVLINAVRKIHPVYESEEIKLHIIHEDDALLVINKPVGMVVHPAAGNPNHTLLNALLHHAPALKNLPRAGIIHRLDKDTSGLLVVAKTEAALLHLTKQIKKRTMKRIYQAIIYGTLMSGGTVDAPIDRHPVQRKRMAVIETGKPAVTHYRVIEKYRNRPL